MGRPEHAAERARRRRLAGHISSYERYRRTASPLPERPPKVMRPPKSKFEFYPAERVMLIIAAFSLAAMAGTPILNDHVEMARQTFILLEAGSGMTFMLSTAAFLLSTLRH